MEILHPLKLTLTDPALPESPNRAADKSRYEKFAKDFESILIERLLHEMKNTIGNWGMEQDGAARQIQGLFWLNLARDVADKGGLGLWKDIYHSLNTMDPETDTEKSLDRKL